MKNNLIAIGEHTVIAPTVHLNGTSGLDLEAQYETATTKVHEAIRALQDASPNARDYYVQSDNAFAIARQEHVERLDLLGCVARELSAIYQSVLAQKAQRLAQSRR
jgi:hypothetical protein